MPRDYFNSVDFSELTPKEIQVKPQTPTVKLSTRTLDAIKDEVLRMIRAVESGDSNLRSCMQLDKNGPFFKAFDSFFNSPTLETFIKFLKITDQDLGRRFRLEVTAICLTFEDFKKFITDNKIEVI